MLVSGAEVAAPCAEACSGKTAAHSITGTSKLTLDFILIEMRTKANVLTTLYLSPYSSRSWFSSPVTAGRCRTARLTRAHLPRDAIFDLPQYPAPDDRH